MKSTNKSYGDYATHADHADSDRGVLSGSPKRSFGGRMKRHCRKFWWLDLLIVAVLVLVILLPIIFVGVKHEAQSQLNKAELSITSEAITNPRPESIHLSFNTTITSHSSYKPDFQPFNGSLFLENTEPDIKPFGYVTLPRVHADAVTEVYIDQEMKIADMDQFTAFNKLIINSEEFRIALRGKTKVELRGLPHYDADYNKVVTMKGLNKLAGFAITSTQIKLTPEPDGATMLGTVSIPNPSVISIAMGNVTMDLYTAGTYLGYTLIPDFILNPGDNSFEMRSYVNLTQAVGFLKNNILSLDIVGNSSVNAMGEHLTYYEAAIKENTIHYDLNLSG